MEECEKASTKAECGTGNYKECLWEEYPDDEGGDKCEFNLTTSGNWSSAT